MWDIFPLQLPPQSVLLDTEIGKELHDEFTHALNALPNYADGLCRDIAQLNEAIASTAIIERGSLRAIYSKPGSNVPRQDRLEAMISQAEITIATLKTNEDQYGSLHYLMSHGDRADIFFFPVWINGRRMSLAVQITLPYSHDELVEKLRRQIGETMAGRHN